MDSNPENLEELDAIGMGLMVETLVPLDGRAPKQFVAKTSADLEWNQVREHIVRHARSPEGAELVQALGPLPSRKFAERRLVEVAEVMEVIESEGDAPIAGLRDIRRAVAYATREGVLIAEDLEAIARNCDVASRTRRFFKHRAEIAPSVERVALRLDPCRDLREALNHAIEPGGRLKDSASPDLRRLRRAVQNQTERIKARVEKMLRSSELDPKLQDDYFTIREDRYVLPIRIGAKGQVDGIVHGYSSSGQTAYIEPQELIDLNNQLRWAQIEVEEEERRILARLSGLVASHEDALNENTRVLAYLDLVHATAKFARSINAVVPELTDGDIELLNARHPLLLLKLAAAGGKHQAVPNDIVLDGERHVLIVSGPNTGGKTVLLKTIGLASLMVRAGVPFSADLGSRIPFFREVYSDIGDEQSIEHDLSTFSAHLVNINGFLDACKPGVLVLLDELFAGTDPQQGTALAVALLEDLAKRGATTFVTTHLESLKTLALDDGRFFNASMGFDIDSLEPTYELTLGIPGSSYALRIANRLGFPETLVTRAMDVLEGEGKLGVDEILARLEDQVSELNKERSRLERLRVEAEGSRDKYKKKLSALRDQERGLVHQESRDLKKKLAEARKLLKERLKEVKQDGTLTRRDVEEARRDLQAAEEAVTSVQEQTKPAEPTPEGLVPIDPEELEIGQEVFAGPFKRTGTIIDYTGGKDAQVQIGVMKTMVGVGNLYHPSEQARTGVKPRKHVVAPPAASTQGLALQTSENTVDLRGMRVEEAVEMVDIFLDAAFLKGLSSVFIIHGHGTGALRRGVRDYLAGSRYIRDWRPGDRDEGGNGVSVAFLSSEV